MYICKNCFEKYVGRKPKESHTISECKICGELDEVDHYNMNFYTWIWENYTIDKRR